MLIRFGYEIEARSVQRVPMVAALRTHPDMPGRLIGSESVRSEPTVPMRDYVDGFGNRLTRFVAPGGRLKLWSDAIIELDGAADPIPWGAEQQPVEDLPDAVLQFLIASRYCESDSLGAFAWDRFGSFPSGWPRVKAICDYVHSEITFGYKFGRPDKTACDVHLEKTGVCRDFAHLAVSLCRSVNIPARYASGYLGDIGWQAGGPGDFCAWFEVYLGGRWHTWDARFNVPRIGRILMVRGCDAADVALITSFGNYDLTYFHVWTDEVHCSSDEDALRLLESRPDGEALVFPSSARIAEAR